jgi:hypothetical protein
VNAPKTSAPKKVVAQAPKMPEDDSHLLRHVGQRVAFTWAAAPESPARHALLVSVGKYQLIMRSCPGGNFPPAPTDPGESVVVRKDAIAWIGLSRKTEDDKKNEPRDP